MINIDEISKRNNILVNIAAELIESLNKNNFQARLLGGIGIYVSCPDYQNLFPHFRDSFSDIDIIIFKKDVENIEKILLNSSYEQDNNVKMLFGYQRRIFYSKENLTLEVYLDNLYLCQKIEINKRIDLSYPAISPTDLFLSKMQKIGLSKKDIFDLSMLLLQYELKNSEQNAINLDVITNMCSRDWRWWKTFMVNLYHIHRSIEIEAENVRIKCDNILNSINESSKSIGWKIRNLFGEKISWYNKVDA